MATHTQLPIYKAAYDLLDVSTDFVKNMQRDFKRSIGEKITNECIEITIAVFRANVARDKEPHLMDLLERLQVVELRFEAGASRCPARSKLIQCWQVLENTLSSADQPPRQCGFVAPIFSSYGRDEASRKAACLTELRFSTSRPPSRLKTRSVDLSLVQENCNGEATRPSRLAHVHALEINDSALLLPKRKQLPILRSRGCHCVPTVAQLPGLPKGYGRVPGSINDAGQDQKPHWLRAWELPMGNESGAEPQSVLLCGNNAQRRNQKHHRVGCSFRPNAERFKHAPASRLGFQSGNHAAPQEKKQARLISPSLIGQASHPHTDRARLANALLARGHCVNSGLTKIYRKQP